MRQLLLGVWLAAGLAAGPASAQQAPPSREIHQPVGHSAIDGVVNLSADGRLQPLRRARVIAASGTASFSTDTDTSGRFHVEQLPAGSYRITVNKFGFVPVNGIIPPVAVAESQTATSTIVMVRGAAIEGDLKRDDGSPAIGLNVSAVRLGYGPYGKRPVSIQDTTTDDLGHYRLHTLLPGEYYILAAPDPLRALSERGTLIGAPKPTPTYFAGATGSGTARLEEAGALSVAVGQEMPGVDFTLIGATYARFNVRATLSSGAAPATWTMRVQRVGSPYGEVRCFLLPPQDGDPGKATCTSVPPGDFWIMVTARAGGPNTPPEFGITRVTMSGRDLPDIIVPTAAPSPVQGRVEVDGGAPLPTGLRVVPLETDYEYPSGAGDTPAVPPATVAADGAFSFPGLPGRRLLRVQGLPAGWALSAVFLGADNIADTPKAFVEGSTSGIRIVVTPQAGTVSGVVLDTNGGPKAGARVVVFSTDPREWHARSRAVATAEVGADGHYAVRGLLPGKYVAIVAERMPDGAWEDPSVLGRLQPTGVAVTIAAGSTQTVDWRPR